MTTTIAKKQNGSPSVSFGNVVDNIFQNSLRRFLDDNFWETNATLDKGSAPVNVRETEQRYEMDVIAPGCKKDNFKIQVHDNILSVSFTQTENKEEEDKKAGWVRNEFTQRSFSRSFTLDETVDVNQISANYADGILHVILPKNEKAKKISRHIEVK